MQKPTVKAVAPAANEDKIVTRAQKREHQRLIHVFIRSFLQQANQQEHPFKEQPSLVIPIMLELQSQDKQSPAQLE